MAAFLLGVFAGYGIAIPVGPIAVLIVQVGMRCGFWCGASAGAGAATADLAYSVLAVSGGVALAASVEAVGAPFRWGALFVAGAFLASLSWQTLLAAVGAVAGRRLPRRFRIGAVVAGNLVVIAMAALIILR